jgi:ADP-ribose pyrophosphatase
VSSPNLEETIITTRTIFEGRVVKLDVHDVRLPDGETASREIIRHSGAAAILPLDTDGQVVMVRQFRLAARRLMLEIPAGVLSPGEDPLACAVRECQEETGLKPQHVEPLGGFFVAPGYTSEYIHLFLGRDLSDSQLDGDIDEFVEVVRLPLTEAVRMAVNAELHDSKTIIALLKVARLMGL